MGKGIDFTKIKKPPLGITPRNIHEEKRIEELIGGIQRYTEADNICPALISWCEELRDLIIARWRQTPSQEDHE